MFSVVPMILLTGLMLFQDKPDEGYRDYPIIDGCKHITKTSLRSFAYLEQRLSVRSLGINQVGSIAHYEVTIFRILDNHTLKVNLYLPTNTSINMTVIIKNLPSLKSIVSDDKIVFEDLFRVEETLESNGDKVFVLSCRPAEESLKAHEEAMQKLKQQIDAQNNTPEAIAEKMAVERTWRLKNGKTIVGRFAGAEKDSVVFWVAKKQRKTIKKTVLIEEDQQIVKLFAETMETLKKRGY